MAKPNRAESEENDRVENNHEDTWRPPGELVIKSLLAVRLASAIFGVISYNNDEVFNNLEPLHMLIHGEGFQTLEYSPTYAKGSYFFLLPYYFWAYFFASQALFSKIAQLMMVRLLVGGFCLGGEYYAYTVICKRFTISAGRLFLFFSIFSAGMFQESVKLSQSSFGMACLFYFIGTYLSGKCTRSIALITLSTLAGCPFNVIFIAPLLCMCCMYGRGLYFFVVSIFAALYFSGAQITLNSYYYYGKFMFPDKPNLAVDKIFSPEISSEALTQTFWFYVYNIGSNWNIASIFALLSFPLLFLSRKPKETHTPFSILIYWTGFCFLVSLLVSKNVMLTTSFYPFIAFLAAVACELFLLRKKRESLNRILYWLLAIYALLSGMRIISLIQGYGAHIEIYKSFNKEMFVHQDFDSFNNPIRLCTGKEWHRFPSSFFIPDEAFDGLAQSRPIEMIFTESNYYGPFPSKFFKLNRTVYINDDRTEITRHVEPDIRFFKTENSTYDSMDSCDYFIDVDYPENGKEQNLKEMPEQWKPIESRRVMNRQTSPIFWRTFLAHFVEWTNCTLYRRIRY
ncbi:unnamed protein product [Caenorhabditis brenneri]